MLSRFALQKAPIAFAALAAVRSKSSQISLKSYDTLVGQCRNYAREAVRTGTRRATLRETLSAPATQTPFALGRLFVAVASGTGIGLLCFYGAGLSSDVGTVDRAALWPDYVRARVQSTYSYFGGGLLLTAASAVAISRTPALMRLVTRNSLLSLIGCIAAMIGTGMLAQSIPYQPGRFGSKQLAWALHVGVVGAVIAPLTILGGPLLLRAALYTAGVVGGLSAVAVCAPSEKFLNMSGPLSIGLGVVFAASLGTWFLPPTTALGAGIYSIAVYGGLVLFSAFLLYDTQRVMKLAESYPMHNAVKPFDPVNASIGIYLDTINIFIRIAMILSGQRRK